MDKVLPNEETFSWVSKITEEFYELVYDDAWFKQIFGNIDQEIITSQQIDFMVQNFGGPKNYCGRAPQDAHPHIWIDDNIWNYRETLLIQAANNVGAPKAILDKWLRIDEAFKGKIINKGGPEECFGRYKTEETIYSPMPDYLKKKAA